MFVYAYCNTNINIHLRDLFRLLLFIIIKIKAKQQNIYKLGNITNVLPTCRYYLLLRTTAPEISNYISFFNKKLIFFKKSSFSNCFF